ncbi:RCC1 domain-containing protein [Pendulispora albinea]|uniref:Uncharacterized protein n=1 Tax=Pendulispora albinea TaxID=2741071 RepID=A0ABZ2LS46_9BACT
MVRMALTGVLGLGCSTLLLAGCPDTVSNRCSGSECAAPGADAGREGGIIVIPAPPHVAGLALGEANCMLLSDGQVRCWGVHISGARALEGRPAGQYGFAPVTGIDDAIQTSAGPVACAVRRSGRVVCWGPGARGMLGDGHAHTDEDFTLTPVPVHALEDAVQVSVGHFAACAVRRNGAVACWGDDIAASSELQKPPSNAPRPIDGITNAAAIAVGSEHACALDADGTVACWGENSGGQTGQPSSGQYDDRTAKPTKVPGVTDAVEIVAGWDHTCARKRDGSVLCWGGVSSSEAFTPSAQPVPDLTDAVELAAGQRSTCARERGGTVVCWGANDVGQLGVGLAPSILESSATPVQVKGVSNATAIAMSRFAACATTDRGRVACWGSNFNGVLGDRDVIAASPVRVQGIELAKSVAAGHRFACAIYNVEAWSLVACWGSNANGALGAGVANPDLGRIDNARPVPIPVPGLTTAADITAGDDYACVRSKEGTVSCWGSNTNGVFGNGTTTPAATTTPQPVPALSNVAEISASPNMMCSRDLAGAVKCWGSGFNAPTNEPETIADLTAVQIAAGRGFACALRARPGDVACWGTNARGTLGDGTLTRSPKVPVNVLNIHDAMQIGAGHNHMCAVRSGGEVMCWGSNDTGQLGIGQRDIIAHPVPIAVKNISDAMEIHGAQWSTCARRRSGKVVCWGSPSHAGNPIGLEKVQLDPSEDSVGNLVADRFAVGQLHACAVSSEWRSGVVCWGADGYGQLGDGRLLYAPSPIIVY